MGTVCWRSASGRYSVDVILGNSQVAVMIDSGLVDPGNRLGFELDPAVYDRLNQAGLLSHARTRQFRDASGRYSSRDAALTSAQLCNPITGQGVGPLVAIFVSRGRPAVPSRVGVAFFHHLKGCRVEWDLDRRMWCVVYP